MKNIAVFGLGKVGRLAALLLADRGFNVIGVDKARLENFILPIQVIDLSDTSNLETTLDQVDTVVSCLPHNLTLALAEKSYNKGLHYFDLTEDRVTTQKIMEWSSTSRSVLMPQCGLAPGFICILGAHLVSERKKDFHRLGLRVGAIDQVSQGFLRYSTTWSPEGLVNEYLNPCEVVQDGRIILVPARSGLEKITINGHIYEAAATSGGLGTLCQTMKHLVPNIDYKSVRYEGHFGRIELMFDNPFINAYPSLLKKGLQWLSGKAQDDLVVVKAFLENKSGEEESIEKFYYPMTIFGESWHAISWTTAGSLVAAIELVASKVLPQRGFINQEQIKLSDFYATHSGSWFK